MSCDSFGQPEEGYVSIDPSRFESSFRGGLVERCSRHTRSSRTPSPFRLLVLGDALGWRDVSRETEVLISFDRTHIVAAAPGLNTLRAPILRWCASEIETRRARDSSTPSQFLSLLSMRGGTSSEQPLPRPQPYAHISGHRDIQDSPRQHQPPDSCTTSLFSFHVKPAFNEQSARQANPRFTFRHRQVHVSRETAIGLPKPSNDGGSSAKPRHVRFPHVASQHRGGPYVIH